MCALIASCASNLYSSSVVSGSILLSRYYVVKMTSQIENAPAENFNEMKSQCGNVVTEVIYALKDTYLAMNEANPILASVMVIGIISLMFYIVYSLKNNNVAKAFIAFASNGKGGGK